MMNFFRSLLFILLFACMVSLHGQTIFRINHYNVYYDKSLMPVATLFTNHSFGEKVAFSAYFYINGSKSNSWGEALAGPTWTPVEGLSLSFLAGIQTNEEALFRFSPVFNVRRNKLMAFGAFEYGGERHRWDVMAFYLADPFKFGAELIRYYDMYAAGPRLEFTFFEKQPLTVFYSGLWDWGNKKYASMFGINTGFGGQN